jgi:hypothetical protein
VLGVVLRCGTAAAARRTTVAEPAVGAELGVAKVVADRPRAFDTDAVTP